MREDDDLKRATELSLQGINTLTFMLFADVFMNSYQQYFRIFVPKIDLPCLYIFDFSLYL